MTLETMIAHAAAVARASSRALVVFDMPFGSYQKSPEAAFRGAARALAETGCGAVKLEGGEAMAATIAFLVRRGVPVMGHVGLTPQSVNALGGYRSQGHDAESAERIAADAHAVAEAARSAWSSKRRRSRSRGGYRRVADTDHRHRRVARLRRPGSGD